MAKELRIKEIFENDIERKIEEVIKVDQDDDQVVADEINEYVVTSHIKQNFIQALEAFDEASRKPTEGVGVWISGFFGSGKSSFAKILGYILENRIVLGRPATDLFLPKANDDRIKAVLKGINHRIPTKSIIFDVRAEIDSVKGDRLRDIIYRQLLTAFGYSPMFTLAELELELERDEHLDAFENRFLELHDRSWAGRKKNYVFAKNEASAVLHDLWPETYPKKDSWARSVEEVGITPSKLATRAVEILNRRGEGRHLVFVIDEIGQYVARLRDRLEDLRAIVEQFGKKGRGLIWLVATSQEKLNEIVEEIYDDKSQLPKVQDRFPIWVDLAPSDIREVTERRVLLKNAEGEEILNELWEENKGTLRAHTTVRIKGADSTLSKKDFLNLYPLLPYHVDLVIDVVSGLRLQGSGGYQVGGSNRTIIKFAQQVIIHKSVNLGQQPVGALVTLDAVYDLLVHNVTNELKIEINKIEKQFGEDSLELRVAKSITLLEFQRDLHRAKENLTSVLYPKVGEAPVTQGVEEALKQLIETEFIRETEDGYKLQSWVEKSWTQQRREISVNPANRQRLIKRFFREQLEQVQPYNYENVRTFRPQLVVDGEVLGHGGGDIRIELHTADAGTGFDAKCEAILTESRKDPTIIHWVVPIDEKFHTEVEDFERSERMIEMKERESLSREEQTLLAAEKERRNRQLQQSNIPRHVKASALKGVIYLEGVKRSASKLGEDLNSIVRGACGEAIAKLFPKFDLAAVGVKDSIVKAILTDANLSGLPARFLDAGGLGLVRREGGRFKINLDAAPLREVHDVVREGGLSGRDIEAKFTGQPYGWSFEAVKLMVACLLRAGVIEARFKNATVKSHTDPYAIELVRTVPNFRGASFRIREGVKLKDITKAARWHKELFGEDIDDITLAESVHASIARRLVPEREAFLELVYTLRSVGLPGAEDLSELDNALKAIIDSHPDDAVKTVATEGENLKTRIRRAQELRRNLTVDALKDLAHAKRVVREAWPRLEQLLAADDELRKTAGRLEANLGSDMFDARLDSIRGDAKAISEAFHERYQTLHGDRTEEYRLAAEALHVTSDFTKLGHEDQERILHPLKECVCEELDFDGVRCNTCRTEVSTLGMHLEVLDRRRTEAARRVQEILGSEATTAHVRVREVVQEAISTPAEAEDAVESIKKVILEELERAERVVLE